MRLLIECVTLFEPVALCQYMLQCGSVNCSDQKKVRLSMAGVARFEAAAVRQCVMQFGVVDCVTTQKKNHLSQA